MMSPFQQVPILRALLPFCAGILWALFGRVSWEWCLAGFILACVVFIVSSRYFRRLSHNYHFIPGAGMTIGLLLLGALSVLSQKHDLKNDFFTKHTQKNDLLEIRLTQLPEEKEKSVKSIAQVLAVWQDGNRKPVSGNVLVYIKKEDAALDLNYGDVLLTANNAEPIPAPRNPGEFDYRQYMAFNNVYYSAYLAAEDWKFTGHNEPHFFYSRLTKFRTELLAYFDRSLFNQSERGVAKALVLGEDNEILPLISSSYSGTGTMHVLSVSGMHVAVVFFLLTKLFNHLRRDRYGKYIRLVLLLLLLWGYAFLTGFSPSVFRAAAMFSFVLVGQNLGRVTSVYNSICVSALVMLAIDPYLIMQVGFQLSYAAVLGIVWLHPKINALWKPSGKVMEWIWMTITVSIAAQAATFPLGLLYFNQLPVYFLISNLIVIPISTVALIVGCIFVIVSVLDIFWFISFFSWLLEQLIYWLNNIVAGMNKWPYAQLEGFFIGIFESALIYIILVTAVIAVVLKSRLHLKVTLSLLLIFTVQRSLFIIQASGSRMAMIHAIPKSTVISIKSGNEMLLLGDSSFIRQPDRLGFYIQRYAYSGLVPKSKILPVTLSETLPIRNDRVYWQHPVGQIGDKTFAIVDHKDDIKKLGRSEFDFIILSKNVWTDIAGLKEKLRFRHLVISSDNGFRKAGKWAAECTALGVPFTNLTQDKSFGFQF
ncbi:MAG: ComEC family competence protein [Bacteroidota bacterium]|nr:ComEC family competence protein [Bacteroidota bacterium]